MKAIFAVDEKGGLGKNGHMPWPKISDDLKRFKQLTENGIVVMGRGTWESTDMPTPLPKRRNVVISSRDDLDLPNDVIHMYDTSMLHATPTAWVIGGAVLINSVFDDLDYIFLTRVPGDYDCDTHVDLKRIEDEFKVVHEEQFDDHIFQVLNRKQ
jgi:dihydrofolate reductase